MQFNVRFGMFIIVMFAMLLAPTMFFAPGQVNAAVGETTGKILYTAQGSNNHNTIYILSDDGQVSQQVETGVLTWGLSWSPDGTRILLNRQEDGLGQIYKLNVAAEGKAPVKLTSGDAHYYNPVWSPTGETIAYGEDDVTRAHPRLMLMAADGSNPRLLYRGPAFFNAWSPDGSQVIITVEGEPLLLDIATGEALPLKIQGFEDRPVMVSDWSKDGQQIAFTHIGSDGQQIYIARIDGTNVRRAVQDTASHHTLKWASDGRKFAFISTRDAKGGEVYSADADGSNVKRLTHANITSANPVRITTLAYWTPPLDSISMTDAAFSVEFDGVAVRDLVNSPVDVQDPISVTRKFMSLLVDGDFTEVAKSACPEYEDLYSDVAQAAQADFSDLDLAGVSFTLVNQTSTSAQVQLSGTMSAVSLGKRDQYAASLFPLTINPITVINLSYSGRWVVCMPL